MSYNKRSAGGSGCILFFLLIYCAYSGIDYLLHKDNTNAKEITKLNDFDNNWKKRNINFFAEFYCNLSYDESKSIKIEKFSIFDTNREYECDIKDFNNTPLYSKDFDLLKYSSDEIKNANVLIWVRQVCGEKVGSYGDGSRAIRLNAEVNFINIKERSIFKKIIIPCVGEPQEKIYKRISTSPSKNYYFGGLPYEQISKTIKDEIVN